MFGNNVRLRREQLGMTQEELAEKIGYAGKTSISKIENGRNVSQRIMLKIAEALDTTPGELMGFVPTVVDQSIDATEIMREALALTGYFRKPFTDEEIMLLLKYAKFMQSERDG